MVPEDVRDQLFALISSGHDSAFELALLTFKCFDGAVMEELQQSSAQYLEVRPREFLRADIFRVIEFPAWILCTNEVKRFVEEQQYTNAGFLEVGEAFMNS